MSTLMVSDECIHVCVSQLLTDQMSCEDGDKIGAALIALNAEEWNRNYPHRAHGKAPSTDPPYKYSPRRPSPFVALKALESLTYNCWDKGPEAEKWQEKLKAAIQNIKTDIVHALPEYEAAQWG